MRFAQLQNGVVISVIDAATAPDASWKACGNAGPGHVSNDGGLTFTPPVTTASTIITPLAFRNRFTQAEKVTIEIACLDVPTALIAARQQAAALRVNQADVLNATFIDLGRADTRAGVVALQNAGIIGAGRAAIILDTPVADVEKPVGR